MPRFPCDRESSEERLMVSNTLWALSDCIVHEHSTSGVNQCTQIKSTDFRFRQRNWQFLNVRMSSHIITCNDGPCADERQKAMNNFLRCQLTNIEVNVTHKLGSILTRESLHHLGHNDQHIVGGSMSRYPSIAKRQDDWLDFQLDFRHPPTNIHQHFSIGK